MQKLIALILSLTFLVQSFNQAFCYLDYMLRRADYEKRCINKAFPKMHCNGKCQLMKTIMEQEKANQGQPPEIKFAARADVLPASAYSHVQLFLHLSSKKYAQLNLFKLPSLAMAIFHPPPSGLFV